MVKETLIHIKFDSSEAVQAEKDFLSSQISLLKITKNIQGYGFYRSKELETKLKILNKIKNLRITLNKLHKALPKAEIPKILKKEKNEKEENKKEENKNKLKLKNKIKNNYNKDLEDQLHEIEVKLRQLQERTT